MPIFRRFIYFISNLKVAIILLLIIALSCAIGTAIPQGEQRNNYLELYQDQPWLGLINGENILRLQLDHVYSSAIFLTLLAWLSLALMICSWRRQWPTLQAALRWVDYKEPRDLKKLAIAQTVYIKETSIGLKQLSSLLQKEGWQVKHNPGRLAARKGVIGRFGPPLIHIGLVLLMIGAVWGSLGGERFERFLSTGKSFELINQTGKKEFTLTLKSFEIDRDPAGRTEQFRSNIELLEANNPISNVKEISVNHPLRFKGLTIYQADWSLDAITLKLGNNEELQLPLRQFPELGEQIWGLVIPTQKDGSEPILLSLSNEKGPVQVFNQDGTLIASIRPGGSLVKVKGVDLGVAKVLPASGLLLKRDPGVPLVYASFAITLLGGCLSVLATKQLWAVSDTNKDSIHLGGLCNRNLTGFATELPELIETISKG